LDDLKEGTGTEHDEWFTDEHTIPLKKLLDRYESNLVRVSNETSFERDNNLSWLRDYILSKSQKTVLNMVPISATQRQSGTMKGQRSSNLSSLDSTLSSGFLQF
jgi:hypothetical protein